MHLPSQCPRHYITRHSRLSFFYSLSLYTPPPSLSFCPVLPLKGGCLEIYYEWVSLSFPFSPLSKRKKAILKSMSRARVELLTSEILGAKVWESIVAVPPPPSPSYSLCLSPSISTFSAGPPSPLEHCPWSRFVFAFLPCKEAEEVYLRVLEARKDAAACLYFLCTRRVQPAEGRRIPWPIRNTMTLRDFLVHPEAARRLMLELEPMLLDRARGLG